MVGYLGVGDGRKMQLAVQGQEVHVVREVLLVVCNLIVRSLPSLNINISTIELGEGIHWQDGLPTQ